MNREKIDYTRLNPRAQENYNSAKLASLMADYGYACIRLSDDYNGADLIALREGEPAMHIQLKGRLTIKRSYIGKDLYIAFPIAGEFFVVPHDELTALCDEARYLSTKSWINDGSWHTGRPSKTMTAALQTFKL